jgi:acyl carrier protein
VELGEIESRLLDLEEIKEAVVLAREKQGGEKYLAAYIVLHSPTSIDSSAVGQIRDYLARSLPDHMIPSSFVPLDKIPLTSNGKVDHRALPEPETGEGGEREYVPPANEVESKLVEIWSELLGIEKDKISINADFFRLGGHSLKAAVMMAKIGEAFDIKVDLIQIFSNPTVRETAALIKAIRLTKEKKPDMDVDMDQEGEELVL